MSIESDLRKDGITVVKQLDEDTVANICKKISHKIYSKFPDLGFTEEQLFTKLTKLNMYTAKIPEGMSEANYFYKNCSIYFNDQILFDDLDEFAIHECIHFLQECKNQKNELIRMGLCDFSGLNVRGLGINEAAVQFTTSKIIGIEKDFVKYYNIEFEACSPSYYPLECNLIEQMAYITGDEPLYNSTFFSTNEFRDIFIEKTSEKTYSILETLFDNLLNYQEQIIIWNNEISETEDTDKIEQLREAIKLFKSKITDAYFNAQNLIIIDYFGKIFNNIKTLEDVENFRKILEAYTNLIGTASDYTFFDNFYTTKMSELEQKSYVLENGLPEQCTAIAKSNKLLAFFGNIRNLISKSLHKLLPRKE